MRTVLLAAIAIIAAQASQAEESSVELKPGAGLDKVVAHCSACHTLDYIAMNGSFLDNAGWKTEVAKMINAFGAPIQKEDVDAIATYLSENYGKPAK